MSALQETSYGPWRADQIREGEPYELSQGHRMVCLPTGSRGSQAAGAGHKIIATDPDNADVGIDTGFTPSSGVLRAPDISAGKLPDKPGWVAGVPGLAVEYADTGQDEATLATKIADLLRAGTDVIWVVRLIGPRRVEIHRPGVKMRIATPGQLLHAPGVLRNPIPVEALYDQDLSNDLTLRNLVQRKGFADFAAVQAESKAEGLAEGKAEGLAEGKTEGLQKALIRVLFARKLSPSAEELNAKTECVDLETLERWLDQAVTASSAQEALRNPAPPGC